LWFASSDLPGAHRRGNGYARHLVNYLLNTGSCVIETILWAEFKLGWKPGKAVVHSFPASDAQATIAGNTLTVENLGICTIVELG
jgi:hypothetical protein